MRQNVLERVRSALRSEPRLRALPDLSFDNGVVTVEGEVVDVGAKKLALERIAGVSEVTGIVDRLCVTPAQRMGDREILKLVRDGMLEEPALSDVAIYEIVKSERLLVRDPPIGRRGTITLRVDGGVVTLDGEVQGLAQKRLAGVLTWWVPGSRDVINGLGVEPPEEDSDDEITEAVRVALEKDPYVNAAQIRVHTANCEVTLDGLVPTDSERDMAEQDAWYVFGVDRVINRIDVHA